MAIGWMSSISMFVLSPGMTISLALRELDRAGHVRRAEVELRAVVVEERRDGCPRPSTARNRLEVCGLIEPGFARTGRSTSSRFVPRSRPALSPAWRSRASSGTSRAPGDFDDGMDPDISTSALTSILPCSMRPVTTGRGR
jgi:hypothetical protein